MTYSPIGEEVGSRLKLQCRLLVSASLLSEDASHVF